MAKLVKVQLPIRIDLKRKGEKLAKTYGLSSYQELLRFWTEQASKGNLSIRIERDEKEEILSTAADERYNQMHEELQQEVHEGKAVFFNSAEELIDDLMKE